MIKSLKPVGLLLRPLFSRHAWRTLGDYVGAGKNRKINQVTSTEGLAQFINSRASHVAQTTLYGYLRTRAGTRFPDLFENPAMLESINIAKWHIWLACVSDLCVFVGQQIYASNYPENKVHDQITGALEEIMKQTGTPQEAGPNFEYAKEKVWQRINPCDWSIRRDDDTIFSESPDALVYWAPIAHELKERDEEIVVNSVRFRWIEIRRAARRLIDIDALMDASETSALDSKHIE